MSSNTTKSPLASPQRYYLVHDLKQFQSQKFRRRFRINSVWNEYLSEIYSFERTTRIEKNKFKDQLRDEINKNIEQIDKQITKMRARNSGNVYLRALKYNSDFRFSLIVTTESTMIH